MYHRYGVILAFALATIGRANAQTRTPRENPRADDRKPAVSQSASKPIHPALVQIDEDPKLPRVLLIGDSITMGYTQPLRDRLKTKANVQHPTENCGPSPRIVEHLDQYLGSKPWDVVQINCGIHDLTHMNSNRKATSPKDGGKVQVPLDEYRSNLEKIVVRLQKTGAKLIWCTTTPLHNPPAFRLMDDVDRYNAVAKEVMQKHGVQINDINQQVLKAGKSMWAKDGVHFSPEGYIKLAKFAAPAIEAALPAPKK